jgi:hypothetical protein
MKYAIEQQLKYVINGIGKICAQTVKNFYHKNNSHNKTLDKISIWVRNNE